MWGWRVGSGHCWAGCWEGSEKLVSSFCRSNLERTYLVKIEVSVEVEKPRGSRCRPRSCFLNPALALCQSAQPGQSHILPCFSQLLSDAGF